MCSIRGARRSCLWLAASSSVGNQCTPRSRLWQRIAARPHQSYRFWIRRSRRRVRRPRCRAGPRLLTGRPSSTAISTYWRPCVGVEKNNAWMTSRCLRGRSAIACRNRAHVSSWTAALSGSPCRSGFVESCEDARYVREIVGDVACPQTNPDADTRGGRSSTTRLAADRAHESDRRAQRIEARSPGRRRPCPHHQGGSRGRPTTTRACDALDQVLQCCDVAVSRPIEQHAVRGLLAARCCLRSRRMPTSGTSIGATGRGRGLFSGPAHRCPRS